MKKVYMFTKKASAFALPLLLLLLQPQSSQGAGKTPTLEYGIIGKNNAPPSMSTHPPPVNGPKRGCNAENYCRNFILSVENPSGTRVEALGIVAAEATLNRSEPGTEAIAAGIAAWSLNKSKTDGNAHGRLLSVAMDPPQMLQLQAVSRGIARMGLHVLYRSASMSAEDVASLAQADGNIAITVGGSASNLVDLKFFTHVEGSLAEADIIHILEYAKAILQATQN